MATAAIPVLAGLPNGTHRESQPSQATDEPFPPLSIPQENSQKRMLLELEDGTSMVGYSFGAERSAAGEAVFSTGMVGYPQSLTDPSFRGQILVLTYPLIGNYGVPSRDTKDPILEELPAYFESNEIHIAGLVVASYAGEDYSHHLAASSLGVWLKENNVAAIQSVDTRLLTKSIRDKGSMLARMRLENVVTNGTTNQESLISHDHQETATNYQLVPWDNPNQRNLVAEVSCQQPHLYSPNLKSALFHPSGRPLRVLCVDVGLKHNQLRCLVSRGVEVLRVPWDFDFPKLARKEYDGLFISNGPGDPAVLTTTVANIKAALDGGLTPIFGICLGHQLLARAAGASTVKMKFGNRGLNIGCTDLLSQRCYITSQNHGYAVDAASLPAGWEESFNNTTDLSNEGIRNLNRPWFSTQFHPEAAPGPSDTEFLFDVFIDAIVKCSTEPKALYEPITLASSRLNDDKRSKHRTDIKKVLVVGSGGISIGQAGEFDYSGSQAIKALDEEGIETILVNPNVATCQTRDGFADKVYFRAVNAEVVRDAIKRERPQGILLAFGGQTALQVGVDLEEEFPELHCEVLGTPINTIKLTEDRELFARHMESIDIPCAKGESAISLDKAIHAANTIGYPVIIRAAYALGGLGSGFAENQEQLEALCNKAFKASPQVLVEKSLKGWKEIEYEVVRDAYDNCITVCNMENFDPLGIHTGDSIVVAPSQTLSDQEYQMLRTAAIKIVRHLGVVGECNVQYALQPDGLDYRVIEVNARLSRSSALASKATGYPLASIAAKIGLGYSLSELRNAVTKTTTANFEPSLDYIVTKIPRWDLSKFQNVKRDIGSAMKSVGEVMAVGRTFEESLQKAIREVDYSNEGFSVKAALMTIDVDSELQTPSDQRLFAIANALESGYTTDSIHRSTAIDRWFLTRLKKLIEFGKLLSQYKLHSVPLPLLRQAKILGFSDRQLRRFWNSNELAVRKQRIEARITPYVKQIDTVAAEIAASSETNYLYMTYNASEHDVTFENQGVMVLGSGAYRIGSSVEFDWCSVRTVMTLREQGYKTVMVNFNPETVSTDFDTCDRLYFENIDLERVLDIWALERSGGVIPCMGGQTPQNIVLPLHRYGVKILGTHPERIDSAENRWKFSRMLDGLDVDQPAWRELTSFEEATIFCNKVTYPVLVRPSFVLSGAGMRVVYSQHDLKTYLEQAAAVSADHPVVISKFISDAKEIEVDAVARDGAVVTMVISEHLENAGVHSGDATLILPPQDLDKVTMQRVEVASRKICKALDISGPTNIQFIAKDNEIKVIECNLRASRSFPFICRTLDIDLIEIATKVIMDLPTPESIPISTRKDYVGVKSPQFSFSRLLQADPVLGVEMASTGECCCFGKDRYEAYLKSLVATGFRLPKTGVLLSIGSIQAKMELLPSIRKLLALGFKLFGTPGTEDFLSSHGIPSQYVEDLGTDVGSKGEFSLLESMANKEIDLYINLPSNNKFRRPASYVSMGYRTRRMAVDHQIPLVTNVKNAKILIEAMSRYPGGFKVTDIDCKATAPPLDTKPIPMNASLTLRPHLLGQLSNSYFKGMNIFSVNQFKKEHLHLLFNVAQDMRLGVEHGGLDILKGKVLGLCFYEPSTRTSVSFDAAMKRLGGQTTMVTAEASSARKGESLKDTLRTLGSYADCLVLRYPDYEVAADATKLSTVPIISGGWGAVEHPTQAFLDLFTIREELGTVNSLTITFVGDLKYGRTVHSLVQLLRHYTVRIQLISAKGLPLPAETRDDLISRGQLVAEAQTLDPELIRKTDVLYCTRIQRERFEDPMLYEEVKDNLIVNNAVLSHAKSKMIVMHPLPRNGEIEEEVDLDERAAYFRQMKYGMYCRMALLALVMS